MSLPKSYKSAHHYFDEVLEFLKVHDWLYNYPNTDILINRVFDNITTEWTEFFKNQNNEELNNLSMGFLTSNAPEDLKILLEKINSFKPHYETHTSSTPNTTKQLKISKKKYHEIVALSSEVEKLYVKTKSELVIDVGSGLGYLPEELHEKYNYRILGIEGNYEKFDLCLERQNALFSNTKDHIKYRQHFVTESSANEIKSMVSELFPNAKSGVLTGLHACADLSITVLKLFLETDFVRGLIIMPCCYHRLELLRESNGEEEWFKNFPLSDTLRNIHSSKNGERFLRKYFLRLSCQQSAVSFFEMSAEEHREHAEQCLFRAVLEEAAMEESHRVTRNKRKTGRHRSKNSDLTFERYVSNLKNTHTLTPLYSDSTKPTLQIDSPSFREKLLQKWHQHKGHCYLVEALTALQMAIQSVCENVVLLDRVEFLREKGVECRVCKVTDDRISPRCYALVAAKL